MLATSVYAYCPADKMHNTGECSYRIHCHGNIRGVGLPEKCQGSTNYPVAVDLVLTDAIERFDDHVDREFLKAVTDFRASGNWPTTTLSFLQYMPRLQSLYLVGNRIQKISSKPFYHLSRLEILDLSYNRITDISDLFRFETRTNKMMKLILGYNAISEITSGALQDLTMLTELDLSHNRITMLDKTSFSNLTNLEVLKLNNNKIRDLNGALYKMLKLKHLYLRGNGIFNIDDESFKIINHLETFDISGNQLQNLSSDMFSRHWAHFDGHPVCKIVISDNHILSVPNATDEVFLARLTRSSRNNAVDVLTELDLSKNSISEIGYNAFRSVDRLTSLNLSCNKLTNFIVYANDLAYVRYLNLSYNFIQQLYFESFLAMSNLQNLDLSHNNLDYIPDHTFTNNYNLKYVNMTHNEFKILKNLHIKIFHPSGGVLDLSNNALSSLTIPIGEGLRMTMLFMNSNNISEPNYINLQHQAELEHLDMSDNQITCLNSSSFNLPANISYLDLSDNAIEEIEPGTFNRVVQLKTLRLARNNLTHIEYGAFKGLTVLLNLDLAENHLAYLNSKVLMDLKSLVTLSVRGNGMSVIDYRGWLNHKYDLNVYVDDNNFTCDWLSTALSDYDNQYSKMNLCVRSETTSGHSLEGIPCIQDGRDKGSPENLQVYPLLRDEDRLLVVNKKILEAIKNQTNYLKMFMYRHFLEHFEK